MINIYTISDATGATAEGVVRAALAQFEASNVRIIRYGGVRTCAQINEIVNTAAENHGFIVHTFVFEELRSAILADGRAQNVTTIDLMGPLIARLSEMLSAPPKQKPGGVRWFDESYLDRIDAIDFAVRHDDGKNIHDLEKAEIVLVGVSRTSKTPLSIYLAYRGWRVANIPIVLGVEPPQKLLKLPRHKVVGLVIKPDRLSELRQVRIEKMGTKILGYADIEHIRQEVAYAYQIFDKRRDWPLVDVTTKPIEETASEIVTLIGKMAKKSQDNT